MLAVSPVHLQQIHGIDIDDPLDAFDGSKSPNSVENDDNDSWCDSRTEFMAGFAATPGAANDVCSTAETCLQDGEAVPIVHPELGDIVITEIFPDPDFVSDDFGEWFEFYSLADTDFHLNGLEIGKSLEEPAEDSIAYPECITLSPGAYAVVANSMDPTVNGDVPAEVIVWETNISLTNAMGTLWLGLEGVPLDVATWDGSAGESQQLDPDSFTPDANDMLGNWCDATELFNAEDSGTPGAANSECVFDPPMGQCFEGDEPRDIVPVSDLEIVELMPNPELVGDPEGEWFEVRVTGDGDLNGLEIRKAGDLQHVVDFGDAPGLAENQCISVSDGELVVFAHEADPQVNGGIPQVDVLFGGSLNNSNTDWTLGYAGMDLLDTAMWTSSSSGASLSKDDNDVWCDGVDPYGLGDLGTPGDPNPSCGGGPVEGCIDPDTMLERMIDPPAMNEFEITEVMPDPDGAPDASGEWFEIHATAGFDLNGVQLGKNGTVSHTLASDMCLEVAIDSYVVFGRSNVDAENCMLPVDHVYAGLSLTNDNGSMQIGFADVVLEETSWASSNAGAALSQDPMSMMWCDAVTPFGCGDLGTPGAANPPCGGGGGGQCFDLQVMMMRDPIVPGPGDLVITEFMANPNAVTDTAGEWFEVRALATVDLNGLELGQLFVDGPKHTVSSNNCIALANGESALLARNGDAMLNGGLPAIDYVYGTLSLTNNNSGMHIAVAGELLDEITWTSVGTGRSTSLDPDSQNPMLNDAANNAAPWCWTPVDMMWLFGGGDYGTPGAGNMQCP